MKSLAVKYRPKTWDDLVEQEAIKEILQHQIETETQKHSYLFVGPAGCGKTTSARIFASELNAGKCSPIEIDAASNSGVDNVRGIVEDAKRKPLDGAYKVFIIDECHSLSNGAWQAFLKLLEEPPATAVFIFCTTDPQKIPATIISRVQRYDFSKMSFEGIVQRLDHILNVECENVEEPYTITKEALEYIAKLAEGGMRDAITMLDQCLSYKPDIELEDVLQAVGVASYDQFQELMVAMLNSDHMKGIGIVSDVYNSGKDLKQFMRHFQFYLLDVAKFKTFGNFDLVRIPDLPQYREVMESEELQDVVDLLGWCQQVNNSIKWDSNPRAMVETSIVVSIMCKEKEPGIEI